MICHEFKGGIGTASRVHRRRAPAATRSASSCRPTTASATGCASTACGSARRSRPARCRARADDGRRGDAGRRRARARSSSSSRPTRRCCRTSASGSRSGPASASPASAAPAATRAATCSSRSRPAIDLPAGTRRGLRPVGLGTYDVRAVGDIVIDRLFDAAIEATEEAIVNALVAATTVVGRDGITAHALPHDRLREVMAGRAVDERPARRPTPTLRAVTADPRPPTTSPIDWPDLPARSRTSTHLIARPRTRVVVARAGWRGRRRRRPPIEVGGPVAVPDRPVRRSRRASHAVIGRATARRGCSTARPSG